MDDFDIIYKSWESWMKTAEVYQVYNFFFPFLREKSTFRTREILQYIADLQKQSMTFFVGKEKINDIR